MCRVKLTREGDDDWVLVVASRLKDKAGLAACVRHHAEATGTNPTADRYRMMTAYKMEVCS